MTLDETVKGEMKSEMSLVERIALYIPIYKGYKEKNLRREEDRAVRGELSRAIQGTKADLATIQRELVSQPELMMDLERIRTKVDRYDISVKKAVNGYSGFHTAVKILEDDLDAPRNGGQGRNPQPRKGSGLHDGGLQPEGDDHEGIRRGAGGGVIEWQERPTS